MSILNSKIFRPVAVIVSVSLTNASVPFGVLSVLDLNPGAGARLFAELNLKSKIQNPKCASRLLTTKEMRQAKGKSGANVYLSGQQKWDPMYKNVDLFTGNYTLSATDLDFQGGYGIPVSIQRTYSANCADEGPFGYGWTLSADVRTTAGGLLKKGSAPVMGVPITLKQKHPLQDDPRLTSQPGDGATSGDSSGMEETIQKDVDGILTSPAWDLNVHDTTYELVTFNGQQYQIMLSDKITTAEGTVYQYAKEGNYPNGMLPQGQNTGTAVPSNVLKCTSVTDRQGNVTQYSYSPSWYAFHKANGTTNEAELTSVQMPNGHTLTLTWDGVGPNHTAPFRVKSISDNGTNPGPRTVNYGYGTGDSSNPNYDLISVTDPAGYQTIYTVGDVSGGEGDFHDLIQSITDPRGLTTNIEYVLDTRVLSPYGAVLTGLLVDKIAFPNGNVTLFKWGSSTAKKWQGSHIAETPDMFLYDFTSMPTGPQYDSSDGDEEGEIIAWGLSSTSYGGTWHTFEQAVEPVMYHITAVTHVPDPINDSTTSENDDQGCMIDRYFQPATLDLLHEEDWSTRASQDGVWSTEGLGSLSQSIGEFGGDQGVGALLPHSITDTTYNFLGKPLSQQVQQCVKYWDHYPFGTKSVNTNYPNTFLYKEFAYWDGAKYWQQKAVVDRIDTSVQNARGRVSFTDYFDKNAAAGSKGQTRYTYQDGFASFSNTRDTDPNNWRTDIVPVANTPYSANFVFDSKGRVTDVYKISGPAAGPYTYVRTNTVYNDATGWWGEPSQVTEDYGGINRLTKTLAYDSYGRATSTQDAAGHIFATQYNADGQVQSVTRTDVTPNVPIVTYGYGTSGINNGQVLSVTDGLSGVVDAFTYSPSGAGIGQVSAVSETWPWDHNGTSPAYTVNYAYLGMGDRSQTQYQTDNGTTNWGYSDYWSYGFPSASGFSRQFQTLRLLDSNNNPTPEEFHYLYMADGSMQGAAFAMTPASGYTPPSGQPWYDTTNRASSRCRENFELDGGGRPLNLYYHWDNWNSGTYSVNNVTGFSYAYDPLSTFKTSAAFLNGNGTGFTTSRTETYGYSSNFDYLTSANYNDGNPNASPVWTYDAAGNRASDSTNPGTWTYDALNRMSASPMSSYSNDILGNRQTGPSNSMTWDVLNRMSSYTANSVTTNYTYRADGLRVLKNNGTAQTSFAYDGQMGFEDTDSNATTDYGVGARGIDRIKRVSGGNTAIVYTIFDGHGNLVADLSKNGSSFSVNDQRAFDAWGGIRSGATTGDPKGRYCANLGHKQDDESGLIYMRARYYEPGSGRFVSEDPSENGGNYFAYCSSNPANRADADGQMWDWLQSFFNSIGPMLQQLGLKALPGALFKMSATAAADLLYNIVYCLAGAATNLSTMGEAFATSDNPWARLGGAILCRLGALSAAVAEMLSSVAQFIIGFAGLGTSLDDAIAENEGVDPSLN